MGNEIVLFTSGKTNIEVTVSPEQDTVWLTQKQMGQLFDVRQATISGILQIFLVQGNWMKLLSVFPIKVPEDVSLESIIWI